MSSTYGEALRLSIFGESHGPAIGMTLDGIPYIGQYSKATPNIYVAAGFNKWGITSSMVSANVLTGIICGEQPDYAEVFSPSRSMLYSSRTPSSSRATRRSSFSELMTIVVPSFGLHWPNPKKCLTELIILEIKDKVLG